MCHAIYVLFLNIIIISSNHRIGISLTQLAKKHFVFMFLLPGRDHFNINK